MLINCIFWNSIYIVALFKDNTLNFTEITLNVGRLLSSCTVSTQQENKWVSQLSQFFFLV
jgi:hypothetical protein